MPIKTAAALVLSLSLTGTVIAQIPALDPDWKELDGKPPASFSTDTLVPVEMPRYVSVKVGIDPATLVVSGDGIVRYVVVALSNSGNVNAAYEGIWCRNGQVKTYARAGNDGQWDPIADPQWKDLIASQPSMHALALARQGVCDGRSASAQSPQEIIRRLKQPVSAGIQR